MKTILLAGGLGSRLSEETGLRPKPMVEIGGKPVLWHIMQIYAIHGFKEFVVAAGYKADYIKEYFLNFYAFNNDVTIDLSTGRTTIHQGNLPDWKVHVVDTGLHTMTGGRIKRLSRWVAGGTFMLTYGDGVGDVDLKALVAFHKSHGKLATVTVVRSPARFGRIKFDGDEVREFYEKPQEGEGWINGGFFVVEPGILDYIEGDDTSFEREPIDRLAREGQMVGYRHDGFWSCMDTLREKNMLEELWTGGKAPWKVWKD